MGRPVWLLAAVVSALACGLVARPCMAQTAPFIAFPQAANLITVTRDNAAYLEVSFGGWGPNWSWLGFRGSMKAEQGKTIGTNTATVSGSQANVELQAQTVQTRPQQLGIQVSLTSDKDTDLTYIIAGLSLKAPALQNAKFLVTMADGSTATVEAPLERKGLGQQVQQFALVDEEGRQTVFKFTPALEIGSDGDARIVLAHHLTAGQPVQAAITIDFPEPLKYYADPAQIPQASGFDQWYTFQPSSDYSRPSELSMDRWIEKPAGKHGRIERQGEDLVYNGKPIKLWGLNLCYGNAFPDNKVADLRAAFYPRYGVNAVRLHKWCDGPGWSGIQSADSVEEFDPKSLDRFDYQNAKFREAGIYIELSQAFGTIQIGPGDVDVVPYAEEFGKFSDRQKRVGGGNSTLYYSPEIQQLAINQITNLLKHRNPYTNLTYAEDPTIAFIECVNESSILFYSSMTPLKQSATLRKLTAERFSDWLKDKYGSQQALVKAWGEKAFDSFASEGFPPVGESLDKRNILPLGNPWFWDPTNLDTSQKFRRQRLLDSLEFLYKLQNETYARYADALRKAGYEGQVVGSNWQAGRMYSHYANLYSDYLVGTVDRHNYFGGGNGSTINNATMLRVPGSGMLSSGMQQALDRPFMLSEWIHVFPSEWGVEGPAIIGAYGDGLQGWDVTFMFQNGDSGALSDRIGRDQWDVTAPQVMGVFPAVSRQVLRGDVAESKVVAPIYVHAPSLFEGKLGTTDETKQDYDVKSFESDTVPSAALAVARCGVEFTDTYRPTPKFDVTPYVKGDTYVSSTDQLRWKEGKSKLDGSFTMDTPGTKAVVGFAEGQTAKLGQVSITPQSRFSAIYVTAQGPEEDVATGKGLLVVAIARARNTGEKVFQDSRIIDRGKPPVVMEPVKATIRIDRPGRATVHVLDQDGVLTDRTLPVQDGQFTIDGTRDKTPYYLVTYAE